MKGPTEVLAEYLAQAKFGDFPSEVVTQGKWCVLDAISCALAGAQMEVGQRHIAAAEELDGKPEATLIGTPTKISAVNAAHFNSELANVLDFDDIYWLAQTHPGTPIVFSALAVGEAVGASGKDLLTAIIPAYEVCLRIARAIRSVEITEGHQDVLANFCYYVFGTAAAASKILGFGKEEIGNAFGIAGSTPINVGQVGTITADREFSFPDIKYNQGIYALIGVFAALRARHLSGRRNVLDDDWFWKCGGANNYKREELTRGLGKEYRIMENCFKPMPACGWTQAPVTAVWEALKGEPIASEDIEEINLFGMPKLMRYEWETIQEAQFSLPCTIAMAIAGPPPGPDWFNTGKFKDPDIRELAQKVKFAKDPNVMEPYLNEGRIICTAEIKTRDGRTKKAHIEYLKGSYGNPFTAEEFHSKFMANVTGILGQKQAEELWQAFLHLEEAGQISSITQLLSPK